MRHRVSGRCAFVTQIVRGTTDAGIDWIGGENMSERQVAIQRLTRSNMAH